MGAIRTLVTKLVLDADAALKGLKAYDKSWTAVASSVEATATRIERAAARASASLAIQVARHWGVQCSVVTRSTAEVQRARDLGAEWAGTYDQELPHRLDAAITFAPSGDVVVAAFLPV